MLVRLPRVIFIVLLASSVYLPTQAETTTPKTYPKLTTAQLAGQSMQWIESQYGKPNSTWYSEGPVKPQWPKITVWDYGTFAVFFERKTVLHTVIR